MSAFSTTRRTGKARHVVIARSSARADEQPRKRRMRPAELEQRFSLSEWITISAESTDTHDHESE